MCITVKEYVIQNPKLLYQSLSPALYGIFDIHNSLSVEVLLHKNVFIACQMICLKNNKK